MIFLVEYRTQQSLLVALLSTGGSMAPQVEWLPVRHGACPFAVAR
jgi:hypothetical protein